MRVGGPTPGGRPWCSLRITRVAITVLLALCGALLLLLPPTPAYASSWVVDTSARTEADIRQAWGRFAPGYTGTPYVTVPGIVAPYSPGETTAAFRDDGLRMLNFGRYLAGLPADVTLLPARNLDAQYGAVLLTHEYSHAPSRPPGMSDAFYLRASANTGSSNIGRGFTDLESFQKSCLYDGHATNVARVGHRRWLLEPRMLYTGMGTAGSGSSQTVTTYAFDRSRPADEIGYAFIAWPSAGLFPVEFTSPTLPWSITLDPGRYDWDRSGHTVRLRRVSDGRTWTFDASDTDPAGEFFSAEFSNYGYAGNAFIFRPAASDLPRGYVPGDQFDVTLSGGIYAEGTRTPVTIKYRTSMCALSGAQTTFAAPTAIPDATPAPVGGSVPVAAADHYAAFRNAALSVVAPGVLANDQHLGGLWLQALPESLTRFGALALLPDGSFTYDPADGWSGSDTFTYVARDALGRTSEPQSASITVLDKTATAISGLDRVQTAVAASRLAFPEGSRYVVIATARSFPDALGGSALAGALGAPILLTEPTSLPAAVRAEIGRLGASHVIVLGGTGVVCPSLYGELGALDGVEAIERVCGSTRYETALAIAVRTTAETGPEWDGTAFVATGESFPDALGASPVAAAKGWPIYLVHPDEATYSALVARMRADGVTRIRILGGTGPVPAEFEAAAVSAFGSQSVKRLAGASRYATAIEVARFGVSEAGLSWDGVALATGEDFPDALAGGPLQGASGSVMLLVYPGYLHDAVAGELSAREPSIGEVRFLGGEGAIPQTIRAAVALALR